MNNQQKKIFFHYKDISKTSTITKISQKTSASSFIPNKRNETPLDLNDMSSNYKSYKTSTTSTATGSRRQSKTRASLEHYAKDYDVSQVKQVGYLTGNNVIRDLSNINLDQFKEFYEDGEQLGKALFFLTSNMLAGSWDLE